MHRRIGRRASIRWIQYEWHGLQSRWKRLYASLHAGKNNQREKIIIAKKNEGHPFYKRMAFFVYGLRMPITLNRLLTNDKSANDALPAGFAPAP